MMLSETDPGKLQLDVDSKLVQGKPEDFSCDIARVDLCCRLDKDVNI